MTAGMDQLTMACHVNRLLFVTISMLAIFSHYRAMTTDPGSVPPDAYPLHPEVVGGGAVVDEMEKLMDGYTDELDSLIKGERRTATTTSLAMNMARDGDSDTNATTTALTRSAAIVAGGSAAMVAGGAAIAVATAGMTVGAIRRTTSSTSGIGGGADGAVCGDNGVGDGGGDGYASSPRSDEQQRIQQREQLRWQEERLRQQQQQQQRGRRMCRRCQSFKPPRAHHCRYVLSSLFRHRSKTFGGRLFCFRIVIRTSLTPPLSGPIFCFVFPPLLLPSIASQPHAAFAIDAL